MGLRVNSAKLQTHSCAGLLGLARCFARRSGDADDLLQSALLVAVEAGRADFTTAENRRWLCGVLKKLSAFDARGSVRRKLRETGWRDVFGCETAGPEANSDDDITAFALQLPPKLRTAALLAIGGHTRTEIGWLLRVSDMAVRQYVTEIRRRWRSDGNVTQVGHLRLSGPLAFGRIRQGLRKHVARPGTMLGAHDTDGYGFTIRLGSQKGI